MKRAVAAELVSSNMKTFTCLMTYVRSVIAFLVLFLILHEIYHHRLYHNLLVQIDDVMHLLILHWMFHYYLMFQVNALMSLLLFGLPIFKGAL